MTANVPRRVVEAFYEAYDKLDLVGVASFIGEDVEWTYSGPVDLLPFCGRRYGKAEVLDILTRVVPETFTVMRFTQQELLIDGDRASTLNRVTAVQTNTGRTLSYQSAHFLRFRNRKIVYFYCMVDSLDAAEQIIGHPIELKPDVPPALDEAEATPYLVPL